MAAISSMPSSSTQYNDIAGAYAKLYPAWPARSPFLLPDLEEEQLKRVLLSPEVAMRGKSVLDLAGETGTIASAHWTGARNMLPAATFLKVWSMLVVQSRRSKQYPSRGYALAWPTRRLLTGRSKVRRSILSQRPGSSIMRQMQRRRRGCGRTLACS